jgi:hypothetical protein
MFLQSLMKFHSLDQTLLEGIDTGCTAMTLNFIFPYKIMKVRYKLKLESEQLSHYSHSEDLDTSFDKKFHSSLTNSFP